MRKSKFLGVYSQSTGSHVARARKTLYFIWELPDTSYVVQELDSALTAAGPQKRITNAGLKANFRPEPGILAAPVSSPDPHDFIRPEPEKATVLTDEALGELERARKARQVETDMRNNFARALSSLNRPRDRKGAIAALEQLSRATKGIVPEHKHMFRDFGVSLRKKSLTDIAAICARRVLELAPDDDHAHFNMARIMVLLGMYDEAVAHLKAAMRIDSSEPVYGRLARYINEERKIPRPEKERLGNSIQGKSHE